MVKTAPSHGAISGSNPLGVTIIQEHLIGALFFVRVDHCKLQRKLFPLICALVIVYEKVYFFQK